MVWALEIIINVAVCQSSIKVTFLDLRKIPGSVLAKSLDSYHKLWTAQFCVDCRLSFQFYCIFLPHSRIVQKRHTVECLTVFVYLAFSHFLPLTSTAFHFLRPLACVFPVTWETKFLTQTKQQNFTKSGSVKVFKPKPPVCMWCMSCLLSLSLKKYLDNIWCRTLLRSFLLCYFLHLYSLVCLPTYPFQY